MANVTIEKKNLYWIVRVGNRVVHKSKNEVKARLTYSANLDKQKILGTRREVIRF